MKGGGVILAKVKTAGSSSTLRKSRPALTPEARENQMISLAVDRAEEQLRDGTASSQIIVHYLKRATTRERLEKELLEQEIALKKAKTEAIQSAKRIEELYSEAINAMRNYSGHGDPDEY